MSKPRTRLALVILALALVLVLLSGGSVSASQTTSAMLNESTDYVDNNTSDEDSSADLGTHSSFASQQSGPDQTNDTLTEEDTGGAGGSTEYLAEAAVDGGGDFGATLGNCYDGNWGTSADDTGFSVADDYPLLYAYNFDSANSGTGTITQVDIIIRYALTQGSTSDEYGISIDVGASTGTYLQAMTTSGYSLANRTFSDVTEPNDASWSWADVWALQVHFDGEKVGASDGETLNIYEFAVRVTTAGETNYKLDLEIQWTATDYDERVEQICLFCGPQDTEALMLYVWNESQTNWYQLSADLQANQWNNFTVYNTLVAANTTLRFIGGTETGDTTQSTWQIDVSLVYVYSTAYTRTNHEALAIADMITNTIGYYQYLYEQISVAVTVSWAITYGQLLYEAITIQATINTAANIVYALYESISLTATVTAAASFAIQLFETIALIATATLTKTAVQILYELISIAGTISYSMAFSRTFFEQITITATATLSGGFSRTFFEAITMLATCTPDFQAGVTYQYLYEIISIAAGITNSPTFSKFLYEAITIGASMTLSVGKFLSESITILATVTLSASFSRTFFEAITITASLFTQKFVLVSLYEAITIAASMATSSAFVRTLFEQITLLATLTPSASIIKNLFEQITIAAMCSPSKFFYRYLYETLTLLGTCSVSASFTRVLTESITLAATMASSGTFIRTLFEAITILATCTPQESAGITYLYLYEILSIAANTTTIRTVTKLLYENIALAAMVTNSAGFLRSLYEGITILATMATASSFVKSLFENITIIAAITTTPIWAIFFYETITLTATFSTNLPTVKILFEQFIITDSMGYVWIKGPPEGGERGGLGLLEILLHPFTCIVWGVLAVGIYAIYSHGGNSKKTFAEKRLKTLQRRKNGLNVSRISPADIRRRVAAFDRKADNWVQHRITKKKKKKIRQV